jgi:CBS domain-containing protein
MQVREVMTKDVTLISPDETIAQAAKMMGDTDCGALPVGENDRLVGMITDRDIVLRAVARGKSPAETKVRDAMSPGIKYVFEDESAETAAQSMSRLQVRRLPVLNRNKRLVGVVALGDLAVRQDGNTAGTALKAISKQPKRKMQLAS